MRVIYTFGVFDLFHAGHAKLLQEVASLGDFLVVGLFTDEVATVFKRTPIIPYEQRKIVLEQVRGVGCVVPQTMLSPRKAIEEYNKETSYPIKVIAKGPGANWEKEFSEYRDLALPILFSYHEGVSTSEIIKKIKEL